MTTNTLIELLQEIVEEDPANGERDVLLAYQISYPLQSTVRGVCTSEEAQNADYEREELAVGETVPDGFIYIVEGQRHRERPYAPRGAFEAARP